MFWFQFFIGRFFTLSLCLENAPLLLTKCHDMLLIVCKSCLLQALNIGVLGAWKCLANVSDLFVWLCLLWICRWMGEWGRIKNQWKKRAASHLHDDPANCG